MVTLWTEEAVCWGWRFCVVCQRELVAQLDGEGRSRELENQAKDPLVGSVSRGDDDVLN